jgi:hypothetical protein
MHDLDAAMANITEGLAATEDSRKGIAAFANAIASGQPFSHLKFVGR